MVTPVITTQDHAKKVGAKLLRLDITGSEPIFKPATATDFKSIHVAIFIHGFTANANYMIPIMEEFVLAGYTALAYNYPCYGGIDDASATLEGLLEVFNKNSGRALEIAPIVVVAHSMGGLVARALVTLHSGHRFVRKVLTLGTPHNGTLVSQAVLGLMVTAGEKLSGFIHGAYAYSAKSALQLTKQDSTSGQPFLDQLNSTAPASSVEIHSFSGGLAELSVGKNWLVNRAVNLLIQRHFNGAENDGLVAEISSDFVGLQAATKGGLCLHHKNYAEFKKTNHTHLCQNQTLNQRGGPANQDIRLSEISASMGDGNRLPRSRSNEKTSP